VLICWKGGWDQVGTTWRGGLLAGALFGLEFFFIAEGLQLTTAAHMSVFLYTAPIFTALGVHFLLPASACGRCNGWGFFLAFVGIALPLPAACRGPTSIGACCWAMRWGYWRVPLGRDHGGGACLALSEAPVTLTLFYQLIVGFVGLLLIALFSGQISHVSLTTVAVASVLFQGLVVSFFSYLTWFWLLRRIWRPIWRCFRS
jgi:drug/metabolite transporter (DMT)-like permease